MRNYVYCDKSRSPAAGGAPAGVLVDRQKTLDVKDLARRDNATGSVSRSDHAFRIGQLVNDVGRLADVFPPANEQEQWPGSTPGGIEPGSSALLSYKSIIYTPYEDRHLEHQLASHIGPRNPTKKVKIHINQLLINNTIP